MKRILALILCTFILVSALSCSGKKNPAGTGTGVPTGTAAPTADPEPPRLVKDVCGMFEEQYDYIYEDIGLVPGTFTVGRPIYSLTDGFHAQYEKDDAAKPPVIYHLAKSLSLTSDDLSTYFTTCHSSGIIDIMPSEEAIAALAGSDVSAAMEACTHPAALYKDGKVYSLRMLLEGKSPASDDEIKSTVENARTYYGPALLKSEKLSDQMKGKLSSLGFEVVKESIGSVCTIHSDEYHKIPEQLTALVDAAALKTWRDSLSSASASCGKAENIVSFVNEFSISKEDFIKMYNAAGGTLGNYNIDVIYSEDATAADTYYSTAHKALIADIEADRAMAKLKEKIVNDNGMNDFVTNVHEFSLAEILLMISKDADYLASLSEFANSLVALPEIDLSGIYDNSEGLQRMIRGRTVYVVDRYVSGRNLADTPYEAHRFIE